MEAKKSFLYYFSIVCFIFFVILGILSYSGLTNIFLHFVEKNYLHRAFRKAFLWKGRIRAVMFLSAAFFSLIILAFYSEFGKLCFTDCFNNIKLVRKNVVGNSIAVAIFMCLLFFAVFSLLSFAIPFQDDFGRNFKGGSGWAMGDSRFLSSLFSHFLHQNVKLPQIAPLPQLWAFLFMIIGSIQLCIILTGKITFLNLLASSLVFVTPFFAGNFSYQYDAPYMTLAMNCAIFPFISIIEMNYDKKRFCLNSIIFILFAAMLYQAAINIYLVLTAFLFWRKFVLEKGCHRGNDSFSFLGYACFALISALLVYKFLLSFPVEDKASRYYSTAFDSHFISSFLGNIKQYVKTTFNYYGNKFSKILFLCSIFIFVFESIKHSKFNNFLTGVLSVIGFSLVYCLSFGFYLVFSRTLFESRAFMGFNVIIPCLLILFSSEEKNNKIVSLLVGLTFYSNTVFFYAYANCMREQQKYVDFRTTILLSELNKICDKSTVYKIAFKGTAGYSAEIKQELNQYPVIRDLLPEFYNDSNIWSDYLMAYNNFITEELEEIPEMPLVSQTKFFDIFMEGDKLLIYSHP